MANLVVSTLCDLKCAYCFAQETLQSSRTAGAARFITLDAFEQRLDFLERSGIDEIRLIGGEPSLHPHFPELIQRARRRNKRILVFTHGYLNETVLNCLKALPPDQCTVLVNHSAIKNSPQVDRRQRQAVLHRLGPRALLGANIYSTNFQLDDLLTLIVDAGCRKAIRLGLAQPILSGQNVYLHPKQFPVAGYKIARFAEKAAEHGVRLEFDCGFVRCMFSNADLDVLQRVEADIGYRCNPILDIDLNSQALHCFPLAGRFQVPLTPPALASDLRASLSLQTHPYRLAGVYPECSSCRFKNSGECTGGCLAATMRRFQHTPIHLAVPAALLKGDPA